MLAQFSVTGVLLKVVLLLHADNLLVLSMRNIMLMMIYSFVIIEYVYDCHCEEGVEPCEAISE